MMKIANPSLKDCRFFILLAGLFILPLSVKSQVKNELLRIWEDEQRSDSIRIDALTECIALFYLNQLDSVHYYNDQLRSFAVEQSNALGLANAFMLTGATEYWENNFLEAIRLLRKSIMIAKNIDRWKWKPNALRMIGHAYKELSKPSKSLDYYRRAALIFEERNDTARYGVTLMHMGEIHLEAKNITKASVYTREGFELEEQIGYAHGIAVGLAQLGFIAQYQKDYKKALDLFEQALEMREDLEFPIPISEELNNIGQLYEEQEDYEQALDFHFEALEMQKKEGVLRSISHSNLQIGNLYQKMAAFDKGAEYCEASLKGFKQMRILNGQIKACRCLYESYRGVGNDQKALSFIEHKMELEASLDENENAKRLLQIEFEKQIMSDSITTAREQRARSIAYRAAIRDRDRNNSRILMALIASVIVGFSFFQRWRLVNRAKGRIQQEKDRAESLLLNILPFEVAKELQESGQSAARDFERVSILFTDFVDFTTTAERLSAKELVLELNECFKVFDEIITRYGLEKIKTIGDAYMAAGGVPKPDPKATKNIVLAAIEMARFIENRYAISSEKGRKDFQMRVGIHTGPAVAGIVGARKFQYDVWGDAVNIASRMESNGTPGKINISEDTYQLLQNDPLFTFEKRGNIQVKGKGEMKMFYVDLKK